MISSCLYCQASSRGRDEGLKALPWIDGGDLEDLGPCTLVIRSTVGAVVNLWVLLDRYPLVGPMYVGTHYVLPSGVN